MDFAGDITDASPTAERVSEAAVHCAPSRWSHPDSPAASGGSWYAVCADCDAHLAVKDT